MNILFDYFRKNYLSLLIIILLIIILIFNFVSKDTNEERNYNNTGENIIALEDKNDENSKDKIKVDIKGAVKKPGLYEIENNSTINDVIKKAGGLRKTATTTDINLSKIVSNEMVIYISTKTEFNNRKNINKCEVLDNQNNEINELASKESFVSDYNNTTANKVLIDDNSNKDLVNDKDSIDNSNGKININKATSDMLQKIPGVGAAKANKIIDYRNQNGQFNDITEIKNVSGIGDSMYEKIKDYITI